MRLDLLPERHALPAIAVTTKQLKVASAVGPSHREGDDVVELESFLNTAIDASASVSLPNFDSNILGDSLPLPRSVQLLAHGLKRMCFLQHETSRIPLLIDQSPHIFGREVTV